MYLKTLTKSVLIPLGLTAAASATDAAIKLSDLVKNNVVKKDVYNAKIKDIEDKILDITNIAPNTTLNTKINEVKGEIPSIINLATTATALTVAVENNIPNVSITQKLMKSKKKNY